MALNLNMSKGLYVLWFVEMDLKSQSFKKLLPLEKSCELLSFVFGFFVLVFCFVKLKGFFVKRCFLANLLENYENINCLLLIALS